MKRTTQSKLSFAPVGERAKKTLRVDSPPPKLNPGNSSANSKEAEAEPQTLSTHTSTTSVPNHKHKMSMSTGLRKRGGMSSGGSAPKKLIIKDFRVKPKLPVDFEQKTWSKLKDAIEAIHTKRSVSTSLEQLYKDVESLCTHGMAENLYKRMQRQCEDHIRTKVECLIGKTEDKEAFLRLVDGCWQDHCQHMLMIRSVFLYLDRTYVLQATAIPSIWQMGLDAYRQHILSNREVESKTILALLELIRWERKGDAVDRTLLHSSIRMLMALKVYADSFERPFLEATEQFYEVEGKNFAESADVPQYLLHTETRIKQENDRVAHYLSPTTRKALISVVEKQFLQKHASGFIEKGFAKLYENKRYSDLGRMYHLLGRVAELGLLRAAFSNFLRDRGQALVQDPARDSGMVDELLVFKNTANTVVSQAFQNNDFFLNALKESFEFFINTRKNRPAELIAKYLDQKLRSGNKGATEEELENIMDSVMTLFRFIQGKDVFEAFYKKDLAKRLLLGKSASFDAEKSMITKLKAECGGGFTNKLEGMFKDIDISMDVMRSFQESRDGNSELSIHVLTMGHWPTYANVEINIPERLSLLQKSFKDFYLKKHQGRKLQWIPSLGHCLLRGRFQQGNKELQVSLMQACVLLLFNDVDEMSYTSIQEAVKIGDVDLKRTLQSLACARIKILKKSPKGRDVNHTDRFYFNKDFSAKLIKIKVNQIQIKETAEEQANTTEKVIQDRQYQIDAAIVRVMKARRVLGHQLLLEELFQQLKFDCKASDLKKRIESLIERDYLVRNDDDHTKYHYKA